MSQATELAHRIGRITGQDSTPIKKNALLHCHTSKRANACRNRACQHSSAHTAGAPERLALRARLILAISHPYRVTTIGHEFCILDKTLHQLRWVWLAATNAATGPDPKRPAMVIRATFYKHYHDKYDLMENSFAEMLTELVARIGQPRILARVSEGSSPPAHWIRLFEHVGQNHQLYEAMLGPRGDPLLVARLREQIVAIGREREGGPRKGMG